MNFREIRFNHCRGSIRRSVVGNDDFQVGVVNILNAAQAFTNISLSIPANAYYADKRRRHIIISVLKKTELREQYAFVIERRYPGFFHAATLLRKS